MRIDKCGIELSNIPRPTQGRRVNRRRRRRRNSKDKIIIVLR